MQYKMKITMTFKKIQFLHLQSFILNWNYSHFDNNHEIGDNKKSKIDQLTINPTSQLNLDQPALHHIPYVRIARPLQKFPLLIDEDSDDEMKM